PQPQGARTEPPLRQASIKTAHPPCHRKNRSSGKPVFGAGHCQVRGFGSLTAVKPLALRHRQRAKHRVGRNEATETK
ncbi:hypothetical protein, partial [Vibrio mediterranei]|uniref:hypothetical protein n=1 Tax=Vibrio mediterranei TaxID=689 RepID=UPI001C0FDE20